MIQPIVRSFEIQARAERGKSLRDSWQGEWCGCSVWHRTTPWIENLRLGFHAPLNTNINNTRTMYMHCHDDRLITASCLF